MPESIPSVLSRRFLYREELGAGGMGRVALVEDLHDSRKLRALKWVGSADLEVSDVRRHRHEYQLLSTWKHPHVIPAYDFARLTSHDIQFFTTDYLRGPSFADVLRRGDVSIGRTVVGQLLHALGFVHHQGWVHSDVKPHNLLLRDTIRPGVAPRACLIDFGLAGELGVPAGDRVLGTVHYMSPERFQGAHLDHRGDLYAVGIMLYQLITGRLPFNGSSKVDVILHQLNSRHEALSKTAGYPVDPRLENLVSALLEKEPDNRPADAHEVLAQLAQIWPEVDATEGPDLLAAYAARTHHAGWEAPLRRVTGRLIRTTPDCTSSDFEVPEFRDDDGSDVLPFRPAVCGPLLSRASVIVGTRAEDRERFSQAVIRRAEILGIPQIQLRWRQAVHSCLTSCVAEIATARALGEVPRIQQAAMQLDHALDRGESAPRELLTVVAGWMRRVAVEVPILVVIHRRAVAESMRGLLDLCSELDSSAAAENAGSVQWLILGDDSLGDDLSTRWGKWCDKVQLDRLDPEAHVRWWTRRLGDWRPPPELDALLERECEGSPGLLERLFRAFIDSGVIERVGGRWSIGPRADLGFDPGTLPGGSARDALEAIAIAGAEATIATISALTGRPTQELADALDVLDPVWVIERDEVYEFVDLRDHFAIKDACAPERWRSGKETIARRVESSPERPGHAERLAMAWLSAGNVDAGLSWTVQAVADRIRAKDLIGTHRVLERAVESTTNLPEALALNLVSLRRRFGPIDAARREVLDGAGMPDDAAAVLIYAGDYSTGLARAEMVDRPSDDLQLAVAEAKLVRGNKLDSIEPLSNPDLEGWRLDLAILREEQVSSDRARRISARLLRDAESNPVSPQWENYLFGRYHCLRGRPELAIPCFRNAAFGFAKRRQLRFQARALVQYGLALSLIGASRDASTLASRTHNLVLRVGGIAERLWLEKLGHPLGTPQSLCCT